MTSSSTLVDKLTHDETSSLKSKLEVLYVTDCEEDKSDILEYILSMLNNKKNVSTVLDELSGIVSEQESASIGTCLIDFISSTNAMREKPVVREEIASVEAVKDHENDNENDVDDRGVHDDNDGGESKIVENDDKAAEQTSSKVKSLRAVKEVS